MIDTILNNSLWCVLGVIIVATIYMAGFSRGYDTASNIWRPEINRIKNLAEVERVTNDSVIAMLKGSIEHEKTMRLIQHGQTTVDDDEGNTTRTFVVWQPETD